MYSKIQIQMHTFQDTPVIKERFGRFRRDSQHVQEKKLKLFAFHLPSVCLNLNTGHVF